MSGLSRPSLVLIRRWPAAWRRDRRSKPPCRRAAPGQQEGDDDHPDQARYGGRERLAICFSMTALPSVRGLSFRMQGRRQMRRPLHVSPKADRAFGPSCPHVIRASTGLRRVQPARGRGWPGQSPAMTHSRAPSPRNLPPLPRKCGRIGEGEDPAKAFRTPGLDGSRPSPSPPSPAGGRGRFWRPCSPPLTHGLSRPSCPT